MSFLSCNFYLRLFNGQSWQLTASGDTSQWLKKLAYIMRLKTASHDECNSLFLIQCDLDTLDYQAFIPDGLPKNGWTVRKLKYVRLLYHNVLPDIICNVGSKFDQYDEYLSMTGPLTPIVEQTIRTGGTPLHSGLIVRDGYGVLLMGPSHIGKSTCCRRVPAPWKAWCDDVTLLISDSNGDYHAHPLPTWGDLIKCNGEITWDIQAHVPVRAIFLLEQSERDEATLIGSAQAALSIYRSAFTGCLSIIREEDKKVKSDNQYITFNNVCNITKKIPVFKLRLSIDGSYWKEIDRVLQAI